MKPEKSDRRIFLGMPGYANQTGKAGEGFWCACEDDTYLTRDDTKNGSLLANNFNQLWCEALNIVHRGGRVDYFAMLHNDIGPGKYWLDKLIDEIEAKDLDVLGVVVPIKDQRGLTSIAIGTPGDNWRVKYRLTMFDVFELPETFTGDDLGGQQLLLNTGCWVCRFDMRWADKVHFEINDRIMFCPQANAYVAQNESEDWFFSRMLHEIGNGDTADVPPLRIGATRKISVSHRGDMDYLNSHGWGCNPVDYDSDGKSPVPGAFPRDIPGWLHREEGLALARLAAGKRVVEIGSYCGLSTVCMARTAEHITAIDYFDGRGTPAATDTREIFQHAIERHGVVDKVSIVHPEAEIPLPKYDLAFIDGAHDYESVTNDIEKCRRVLKRNGIIAIHDYKNPVHPEVTQAIDELIADGGELMEVQNTLAVVKAPALIPLEV